MDITFASLLTIAGASTAGAIITTLVEVIKAALPGVDARVSGATLAFIASTALFVVVGFAMRPLTADLGLQIFVSWLNVTGVAIGLKAVTTHVQLQSVKADPSTTDVIDDASVIAPVDEPKL